MHEYLYWRLILRGKSQQETIPDHKKVGVPFYSMVPLSIVGSNKNNHDISRNVPQSWVNLIDCKKKLMAGNPRAFNSKQPTIGTSILPPQVNHFFPCYGDLPLGGFLGRLITIPLSNSRVRSQMFIQPDQVLRIHSGIHKKRWGIRYISSRGPIRRETQCRVRNSGNLSKNGNNFNIWSILIEILAE